MLLTEVRDAITALRITEPWGFTGADFIDTLSHVNLVWGSVTPPFALDLDLSDRFLLVDHIGHLPESWIMGFTTLQNLEFAVLSGSGLMNHFTTFCVAFVAGKAAPFRILYRDESGSERVFDKGRQLQRLQKGTYGPEYPDRRIEWL